VEIFGYPGRIFFINPYFFGITEPLTGFPIQGLSLALSARDSILHP
jgi:hypothetical protein